MTAITLNQSLKCSMCYGNKKMTRRRKGDLDCRVKNHLEISFSRVIEENNLSVCLSARLSLGEHGVLHF